MDIEQENRFKTLIQPIRDLSLNWDIDIAEELGDYLEELDHLQITLDTGHSNLNFAEAALLIQGSAAVYSKKVEYLHQLVLNALELITFQKSTKAADGVAGVNSGQANQSGQKGVKAINMAFLEDERILFGSDPEYLLLDDVLEEGVNIALYIPKNSTKDPKLIRRHSLSGDLSKSSMILMHTILHVDNGSTSLRLSTCRMDANGALLIGIDPATSAATSEQPLEEISMIAKNNTSMYTVDSRVTFEEDERGRLSTDMPAAAFDDRFDSNHYDDDGGNDHYMPSYDDNIGRDDEEYAADDCAPASSDIPFQATNGANMNGSRQEARSTARTKYQHSVPAPARKVIPSPLDPHEANTGSKSCRKGHTYRVPSCLTKSKQQSSSTGKATAFDQFQRDPSTALLSGRIPLLGLVNAEFQDLAKEIRRSYRSEQFRKRLAAQKTPINDDDYLYKDPTEVFDDILVAEQANAYISDGHHEPEKYWEDEEDEDDGMPMYWHDGDDGLPMNDVDDLGDHVTSVLDKADIQALASFSKPKPLYSNPFAAVFEEEEELELARRVEDALNDSMSLGNTYESLCRRHIQDFMKGAEVYARETQLSRRVSDWTRRLEPVLRQQEESTAFDIFTYADTLLSKVSETVALPESTRTRRSVGSYGGHVAQPDADTADVSNIDHVVGIEEIAAGMNASEFSRMFLACLQLANSGNIDIITSADMNMTSSEHHHNQDADTLVRVPETNGREYIHPNFFGIHLLNANATFGLQMNLDYSTNEEIEVPKAKSSSSMRSKAAPVSSLSKAVQPQPTSTLE